MIHVHQLVPRDEVERFVYSSWLRSSEPRDPRGRQLLRGLDRADWYRGEHGRVESLLARHGIAYASPADDSDCILGWACADAATAGLHYCYVKHPYRRQGIATLLLEALRVQHLTFEPRTPTGRAFAQARRLRGHFTQHEATP